MWFATPLALIMLVPWAIIAWWLRRGRGEPMAVPFVHLWPRDGTALARRRHHPPPAAIWLAMLGLLLLLLAAAQPQLAWKTRPRLAVILDRGATMSAQVAGQTRLVHFLDENRDLLGSLEARLDLQFIPAAGENGASPSSSVVERARAAGPTAADTLAALNEAARRAVKQNEAVLIITDRELDLGDDARFRQIGPRQPIPNAAIVDASLGDGGLLVSFTGTTAGIPARFTVEAGDERFQQEQASPAPQGIAEALVPLPALLVDSLKIELSAEPDAWPGDNVRFIARERAWPDIRPAEDIPPEIRRVASLFTELRPPRPHSRVITIGLDPSASAIVAPVGRPASGEWQVAAHDLTAGVDWPGLAGVRVAAYPFEDDPAWRVLVRAGADPVLAVREDDRRLWLGLAADGFEQDPAFVRFWTDALTWLNGGPERWAAHPLGRDLLMELSLEEALARVTVEGGGGGPVAWTLPPVDFGVAPDWNGEEVTRWLASNRRGTALASWLVLAALAAGCGAAWLWPARRGRG